MCDMSELRGRTGEITNYTLASIEQKFQHFLNATVRAGSVYGGCGGYARGTWSWDQEGEHWIVRRRPRIPFSCSPLAASFMAFWFNYNADSERGWTIAGDRIQFAFNESVARHNAVIHRIERQNLCGYKEFVEDGSQQDFYGGNFFVSRIGTIADFINDGTLLFLRRRGGNFFFKWNPDRFSRFNVLAIGSHHVIMYIKRGNEGANSYPTDRNIPHQIWRFAADSPENRPTTWREEEIRVIICPTYERERPLDRYLNNQYHKSHRASTVHQYTIHQDCQDTNFDSINNALLTKNVTFRSELPHQEQRWLAGCDSIIAIWKLKDLRSNGKAPEIPGISDIINNPSKRIVFVNPRRESTDVEIPRLTGIQVSKLQGEGRVPITEDNPLHADDILEFAITSIGVASFTRICISVFDMHGFEKLPYEIEITGNNNLTQIRLLGIVVPNPPDNYIFFRAWIYEVDINVETELFPYW
jgi:hypothetical protein